MTQLTLAREAAFGLRCIEGAGGLRISLLPNGCLYAIEHESILINQVLASPIFGGIHRIDLRVHDDRGMRCIPVVGPSAMSAMTSSGSEICWSGCSDELDFGCQLSLHPSRNAWLFRVEVRNTSNRTIRCDVIQLQDVGLATRGQVRNNELFTAQYIDQFAIEHDRAGWVVMSRQNLPQPGETHPWLMQGCYPNAVGFVTDGFDFFGTAHRGSGEVSALTREAIGSSIRQYEASYIAIQSNRVELKPSTSFAWTFFAEFVPDHPQPSSRGDLARIDELLADEATQSSRTASSGTVAVDVQRSVVQTSTMCSGDELSDVDVNRIFVGERRHVESSQGAIRSFFYGDDARHVVLRDKELSSNRSHGHILRAGPGLMPDDPVLSCTCWAPGVFAAPITFGNASLSKLFSGVRDALNIVRSNGLRMFVRGRASEPWQILAVPSAFEMSLNECLWHYKRQDRLLTVRCVASQSDPALTFEIRAEGLPVELLICGEIAGGPMEYETMPRLLLDQNRKRITVRPDDQSLLGKAEPELSFHIVTSSAGEVEAIGADEALFADGKSRGYPYATIRTRPTNHFRFTVLAEMRDADRAEKRCAKYEQNPDALQTGAGEFWSKLTGGMKIRSKNRRTDELQDALVWFARDAVVHLGVPRGLDQPNGGAWGVRDVCQGAVEFLLSYGHDGTVAEILRRLFSQQYDVRYDWPQWFMFPPFHQIQSPHCHGDVAIWPLKALCDYLEQTNDPSILHESLPYTSAETFQPTDRREELLRHVDRLIEKLREQFLPGLSLPRYGEGDWDDSLQPADPALRDRMVSSWTSELMYQTLKRYGVAMSRMGEGQRAGQADALAEQIRSDFQRYLMPDQVVAGFAVFDGNPPRPIEYLLHPSDSRTGLRYRLIPMTRGILSEIFSPEQAQRHVALIQQHLLFPDGARLMDRPAEYRGGLERSFRRSESAAFFGREIGLQYVHAHLRYAQAMAKLGRADDLWYALQVVNPIAITRVVPGALPRQRNCYFSSSDAIFGDRYQASRDYEKLRQGHVPCAGGWRIYSSGPGIFTNLVIQHLFGIRSHFDSMEFDPVLPGELDGVSTELTHNGRRFVYDFHVRKSAFSRSSVLINGREINGTERPNPYRKGGFLVPRSLFEAALISGENRVEIFV